MEKDPFSKESVDLPENTSPHYLVFPTSECGFTVGRRKGVEDTQRTQEGGSKDGTRIRPFSVKRKTRPIYFSIDTGLSRGQFSHRITWKDFWSEMILI